MANVVEFDFVDGKSGKITYTAPATYVAATGSTNCQTGQNVSNSTKWRAFFNFDTSSLPDTALVSKVEFLIRTSSTQPTGAPEVYVLKFSIGTFIGAALNGNSGEFNGGTLMVTLGAKPADSTWLDLDQDANNPEPYVNLTGDTDLKVWDDSSRGSGDASWGLNFNGKGKCRLRVTYTIPSATATGRGTASGIGAVTVAGRSTATGHGTAQTAATVRAFGTSTATGRGTAQAMATVRSVGASTATGRGSAQVVTIVVSSASASATGRGLAEAGAAVSISGSCGAAGRGVAELFATVLAFGSATATGQGTIEFTAWVTVVASVTATGRGFASCAGESEEQTASATATGRGLARCRLTAVYFVPLARHSGTRSVRFTSADARSVSRVHNATRVCVADDAGLRGARRMN